MFSPIITVLKHYPLRSVVTITLMLYISIYSFKNIRKHYNKNIISHREGIILWCIINYVMLLLFFTVIGRRSWDYYRYNFEVGYSYRTAFEMQKLNLVTQIFANIVVFIPLGGLYSVLIKKLTFIRTVLGGILLSFMIEVLQLVLKRGCCEFDDIISNSIGTVVGYLVVKLYYILKKKINSVKKDEQGVERGKNVF